MISFFLPYIGNLQQAARTFNCLTLFLVLGSCANVAPRAIENVIWDQQRMLLEDLGAWQLRGRVNVAYKDENDTPRIRWQQQDTTYNIRLWGTFNVGMTVIEGRPGLVTMEHDGELFRAASPEDLILQQLGYELPVSYLEFWIRGLPAPDSNADMTFNELNQLSQMNQGGWTISFEDPRQYGELSLPREVVVARVEEEIRLTFFGLNWTLDSEFN
ncbi:MAG: lipoprotein insertase outer membrane protein LolB [Gammaproteobacteria bacterium]|nr:lipoprotein insertase outer membrane protein LolB [Gammaproteobacteria bacterium]MDD9895531.1 lipoprotein insertase outer membrane protein LolB [Gammaproteobacteria bacterium]MDD9959831.1 lipoprotein insertase outer membrane protein LolB [Gammaproteobacteria bacterium]